MTIKTCFTILAVLSFLFGVSFVLSPAQVLSNYGIETSPALALMGRLFGGVLLTPSVILWLAKDFRDEAAVRGGAARCTLRGCRKSRRRNYGHFVGVSNPLGWSTVLIYLYGAVGAGYFLAARASRLSAC